jgi:hypothetical protein
MNTLQVGHLNRTTLAVPVSDNKSLNSSHRKTLAEKKSKTDMNVTKDKNEPF